MRNMTHGDREECNLNQFTEENVYVARCIARHVRG